jgi:glyoxylase-like metal-dependent hydrolase (beta-lactamase superfamily II)
MPIDRRQFIALSAGALAASPLARAFAQQPVSAPPVFTDLRRNVGIFTARGGTIGYLINKDGVIAVDTQYADTAKACVDGLKQKAGRGIDVVFNTHHHGDHTGGNGVFKAETKKIVAHEKVPELQKMVAAANPNAPAPVLPDATFGKVWTERPGNETVSASYHGPAHTSGDAIIHFERAHVVHMGDLLFHERHPRVDRAAGASMRNWVTILEKAAKDFPADTIFIAGHAREGAAPTVDRKAVLRFRDYLAAALDFTQKEIARGQAKDAIAATAALAGFDTYQGGGVLTLKGVLEAAYDELTSKPQ